MQLKFNAKGLAEVETELGNKFFMTAFMDRENVTIKALALFIKVGKIYDTLDQAYDYIDNYVKKNGNYIALLDEVATELIKSGFLGQEETLKKVASPKTE